MTTRPCHRLKAITAATLIVGALTFSWATPAAAATSDGGVRISSAAATKADLCHSKADPKDRHGAISECPPGTWMHQHRVGVYCEADSDFKTLFGPWVGGTSVSKQRCPFPLNLVRHWNEEHPDHP